MIIGTTKEIKDHENRVGLTPSNVKILVENGHKVIVQKSAGEGAHFSDEEYADAGAELVNNGADVFKKIDILVKVKEPISKEYSLLSLMKNKALYTYLHLAGVEKELTLELIKNNIMSIAYETIEDKNGKLPCLTPMSKIAGILAVQYASQYLQRKYGGRGLTLGHIKGAEMAKVVIIGGGVVGKKAALTAAGMGSQVTVFEINEERAQYVREECAKILAGEFYANLKVLATDGENLKEAIQEADVLVGAVLVKGAKAPKVITNEMIDSMKKGSVIIDVAIDQGGCIWGSRPTSHSEPIFNYEGKIYCCVPNMPGQVALQSTQALTSATIPYLLKMANKGIERAMKEDAGLAKGLNVYKGKVVYKAVADALDLPYSDLKL